MIRLVLYFVLVAAVASGLAWFADHPGNLTVDWLGYKASPSVFIAALLIIAFLAVFMLAVWLSILAWTAPRRIARRLAARRRRVGNEALRRGIFAAGAGDRIAAMKAGAIARKNLPGEPLALLLEAQSAQLNEDAIASRQAFERMLEKPEMAEVGLRGLYIEAKKAGQQEAAKQFAERALASNPALTWSSAALFEMQCGAGDWRGALRTLEIAKQNRHLKREEADRRRALLLTALAAELEDSQQSKALAYALEANAIAPSLIPAAAIAGRLLAAQGNAARAAKLTAQAWRIAPHPELALVHAHARTGDSPRDRLARVKALVAAGPASLEGDIAVAVAAVEAKEWATARTALEPHLANNPPARVCRLMARIEAGQNRDAGRAREWLAKASRGAPDPLWVAPDGTVSSEWRPLSPASGALGVFEWKTPPSLAADNADDIMAEMNALDVPVIDAQASPHEPDPVKGADDARVANNVVPLKKDPLVKDENDSKSPDKAEASSAKVEIIPPGGSGFAAVRDAEPAKSPSAAAAGEQQGKTGKGDIGKFESRKPKIFVPGPAPDDPGPRGGDGEDGTTPLSRFRSPSS